MHRLSDRKVRFWKVAANCLVSRPQAAHTGRVPDMVTVGDSRRALSGLVARCSLSPGCGWAWLRCQANQGRGGARGSIFTWPIPVSWSVAKARPWGSRGALLTPGMYNYCSFRQQGFASESGVVLVTLCVRRHAPSNPALRLSTLIVQSAHGRGRNLALHNPAHQPSPSELQKTPRNERWRGVTLSEARLSPVHAPAMATPFRREALAGVGPAPHAPNYGGGDARAHTRFHLPLTN